MKVGREHKSFVWKDEYNQFILARLEKSENHIPLSDKGTNNRHQQHLSVWLKIVEDLNSTFPKARRRFNYRNVLGRWYKFQAKHKTECRTTSRSKLIIPETEIPKVITDDDAVVPLLNQNNKGQHASTTFDKLKIISLISSSSGPESKLMSTLPMRRRKKFRKTKSKSHDETPMAVAGTFLQSSTDLKNEKQFQLRDQIYGDRVTVELEKLDVDLQHMAKNQISNILNEINGVQIKRNNQY